LSRMGIRLKRLRVIPLLVVFLPTTAWAQSKPLSGFSSHEVVRVIDGDTIILKIKGKRARVRLKGIDTPEVENPYTAEEPYGKEASVFLKNLLRGELVYLRYEDGKPEYDKYKRLLAYVYRAPDMLFVNEEIVRQGYGVVFRKFPFQYKKRFQKLERKAKKAKKGMWEAGAAGSRAPPRQKELRRSDQKGTTVYITRTGKKYHAEDCRYLRRSKIPISLKKARRRLARCVAFIIPL